MDIAGLDVLGARDAQPRTSGCPTRPIARRSRCRRSCSRCSIAGLLGEKAGRGFYERRKSASGESEIWTLDLDTLEYRPQQVGAHRRRSKPASRSTTCGSASGCCSTPRTRPASSCARRWRRRSSTPRASRRDIAHSIDDVDRVMRWGFGWELGPFELFDAIGVREVLAAAQAVGGHAVRRRRSAARCSRCSTRGRNSVPRRRRCRRRRPIC